MKIILSFFVALMLFIVALTSSAQDFEYSLSFLRNKDGQAMIVDNEKDWKLIGSAANFDLYIDKYMLDKVKEEYTLHGVTIYKDGEEQKFDGLPFQVKKIYTFGRLICRERALYVLNQWYTTNEGVVLYSQNYNYGEFVSDMNDPNTTRNLVYIALCGDKV
jgi:hypothetical protein